MTISDLVESSLIVGLVVLVLLMIGGAFRLRRKRIRRLSRKEKLLGLARYALIRLPLAIGCAVAMFVLGAAALTLNSHRPPGDNSPVITVPARSGTGVIDLVVDNCEGDLEGRVKVAGRRLGGSGPARLVSDQDGRQRLRLKGEGAPGPERGSFSIEDPLARRGLLSCYLQVPVLRGARAGYAVHLKLAEDMEVDTQASVPVPDAYTRGEWIWHCPAGQACPGFVAINYAVEDGAKQVIVLVLASVFGALIALLVGDVLIEWGRRRLRQARSPGSAD